MMEVTSMSSDNDLLLSITRKINPNATKSKKTNTFLSISPTHQQNQSNNKVNRYIKG